MSPEKFFRGCIHPSQIKQAIRFADKLMRESSEEVFLSEACDDACRMADLPEEMIAVVFALLDRPSNQKDAILLWAAE